MRGAVVERAGEATSRAIRLVELEKSMGLFWETQMQAWVMSSEVAVRVFNGIYVWAHFPLVAAIGLWMASLLDRYGHRIWALVVPQSLRRARA